MVTKFTSLLTMLSMVFMSSQVLAQTGGTPVNFTIAFIADQGLGPDAEAVLNLILNEGAHAVVHSGDFDYANDPAAWEAQINSILGANFPYFSSVGNHEEANFYGPNGYQEFMIARMNRLGLTWDGDLGIKSSLKYNGIFIVLTGPDVIGVDHDIYIRDQLAADNSTWSISSWHKNMRLMQVGGITDATGWGVYEESRKGGAIIATGHEHSYSRTHLLSSCEFQTVSSTSNTLVLTLDDPLTTAVDEGNSFVFVSGLGGASIRDQELDGPWWASIYTSTQGANLGALFGIFNHNGQADKAHFYFKDIDGVIPDMFDVISNVDGGDFTLTTNVSGLGSVTHDPPGGSYDDGTVVTLTAIPDCGWGFSNWSGDLSGSNNPETILMGADKNVTAVFTEVGGCIADDVSVSETAVKGSVTNSFFNTQASDDSYEAIEEVETSGKPTNRYSFLEHKWTIDVTGGNAVTFYLEAYKTVSSDGDDFSFAYSTDDATYIDMVTVTKTSDDGLYQTYPLPSSLSGLVYIRVLDTDQTAGNRSKDEIFVDHLFIRSDTVVEPDTEAPTVPQNLTAQAVSSSQIDLAWHASTDNVAVAGYKIFRDGLLLASTTNTNYSDTGLNVATQYCYTAIAFDAASNESAQSNQACATTQSSPVMHVQDISIDYTHTGPWHRYTPTVLVHDNVGSPVSNATVTGEWSGALSGSRSATTDASGLAVLAQSKTKSTNSVTFCVTNVSHSSAIYDPLKNIEDCATAQLAPVAKGSLVAAELANAVPTNYQLAQNYPNPFNPDTEIRFQLPTASQVVLSIYNTRGQKIRALTNSNYASGYYSVFWDGKDDLGNDVANGVYLYRMQAGAFARVKKMSLVR